jgi:molybdopterin synthase catalytic subunit
VAERPTFENWLEEVRSLPGNPPIGMCLMHNGVVRGTARDGTPVSGMDLSYDAEKLCAIVDLIRCRNGIAEVRAWINQGRLSVGDDIMRVLVAGDNRDNVFAALQELVRLMKTDCIRENELPE